MSWIPRDVAAGQSPKANMEYDLLQTLRNPTGPPMDARQRRLFDRQLERVLSKMPPQVHDLLEEVPLFVEDHPSASVMRQMGVEEPDELCGLYSGVPLDERGIDLPGRLPDVIFLYRLGIMAMATDEAGDLDLRELRRQIRITLLHELAHHHGIGEHELESLGFD